MSFYTAVLLAICCVGCSSAEEQGYELLFTSNPREYENLAVEFEGTVPRWLKGSLIRNGMGLMELGDRAFHHAFDGYAKLMKFEFSGSSDKVRFSTRFLHTKFYVDSRKDHTIAPYLLFDRTVPEFNYLEKVEQLKHGIDNTNINVKAYYWNGSADGRGFAAVSDFWQSYQFDPVTLKTLSYVNPKLPTSYLLGDHIPLPSTAHAVSQHRSSSYISFVSYMSPLSFFPSYINVIRIKSLHERENIASIKCERLPYMHAIGLSENYAVIFADPVYIDTVSILEEANPLRSLEWTPSDDTTIHVVDIHNGKTINIKVPAKFHLHHVNSYENGRTLIVDYVAYNDFNFLKGFLVSTLWNATERNKLNPCAQVTRYEINLDTREVKIRTFEKPNHLEFINRMDFPAINEKYRFKNYCYTYGIVLKTDGLHLARSALVKNDVCGKGKDLFWHEEDHQAMEPVFVPSPDGVSEDDGVLLTVVLDGRKKVSYVAVFDAKNMKIIGRGYLNDFIPFTLHGEFYGEANEKYQYFLQNHVF